ncbi:hypothetical protein HGRIS_004973 [Hohenbuehelia grisea]|uniref:Uncharacterized protein n=1 Tax=Hohenbuehelia grisea TaxID=104357 RepID=A0ABR3JDL3_9AGAR
MAYIVVLQETTAAELQQHRAVAVQTTVLVHKGVARGTLKPAEGQFAASLAVYAAPILQAAVVNRGESVVLVQINLLAALLVDRVVETPAVPLENTARGALASQIH